MFDFTMVDEKRKAAALDGNMTPYMLDRENQVAEFLGSNGTIHKTSLGRCTCSDYKANLRGQAPCKHIIRLAMELDLMEHEGMKNDAEAVKAKYYDGFFREIVKEGPEDDARKIVNALWRVCGVRVKIDPTCLQSIGIEDAFSSGLVHQRNSRYMELTDTGLKLFIALDKIFVKRFGSSAKL